MECERKYKTAAEGLSAVHIVGRGGLCQEGCQRGRFAARRIAVPRALRQLLWPRYCGTTTASISGTDCGELHREKRRQRPPTTGASPLSPPRRERPRRGALRPNVLTLRRRQNDIMLFAVGSTYKRP